MRKCASRNCEPPPKNDMPKSVQSTTRKKQAGRGVWSRLRRRRVDRLPEFTKRPLFQAVMFGIFVLCVVGVMTFGSGAEGRVYEFQPGEVAPQDLMSSRDFIFTERDRETLDNEREIAARNVAHVYDWQEGLGEQIRERIRSAFGEMRTALANTIRASLAEDDPKRLEQLEETTPPGQMDEALIGLVDQRQRVSLSRELRTDHFDTILGMTLRESDFDTFARAGFPSRVESALGIVVSDVMTKIIVPSRRILESGDEAGVFLRRLRDDKVNSEYRIGNVEAQVVALERVPALVEEVGAERLTAIGDRELRSAVVSTATVLVQPNTTYNAAETSRKREEAREAVEDKVLREEFRQGQIIVDRGHLVTDRHVRILQQMQTEREILSRTQVVTGVVLFALMFLVTLFMFGWRNIRRFSPAPRDLVFVATTVLLVLAISRVGLLLSHAIVEQISLVPLDAWYYFIPVAATGMLIRLVLNSETAIVVTVLFAALVGLMADNSLFFMCYAALGGLVGAASVRTVKNRMGLVWSGVNVAFINAVAVLAFLLIDGRLIGANAVDSAVQAAIYVGLAMAGGVAAGFVATALLPIFEAVFGYTTDIKLLELSSLDHPALRELIMRAPGSYHHSMMVGSLSEAASEAIGANALLSRVGAYYHDIGKGKNPQYFAENQKLGENPHDKLKPNISALVIKAHVKDGIEMARNYRLPVVIQDFVAQHHGTSLIRYFYHKAKQLEDPDIPEVVEDDYRYPGPKPQTRETAICLLADGIEAASRAMPDPSPARLRGLVQKMINLAFTDGQLDECDLTLKDLNLIADAFHRILTGIYHHRPEYPGPERKRGGQDKKVEAKPDDKKSDELKRKPVRTDRVKTVTPSPATPDSVPTELEAVDSDASGDWEITQAQRDNIEGGLNAGRHPDGSDDDDSSDDGADRSEDSQEGRQSLPRLGSS